MSVMSRVLAFALGLVLIFFTTGCATSSPDNVTVTVEGVGATVSEAKKNGFRDAIQLSFGNLVLSERRVTNDKLFEDDVSYARGVIDSFQILTSKLDPKDRQHHLIMQVTVSPTAIQHRLLASQDSARVDGNEITRKIEIGRMQAQSEVNRYMSARRLFEHVSHDFTFSVFDIKTANLNTVRNGAEIFITQDVSVSYNRENIKALCLVAREYHESRTAAVPNKYRTEFAELNVLSALDCYAQIKVEPVHIRPMVEAMKDLGICLKFSNQSEQVFQSIFYDAIGIGLIKQSGYYREPGMLANFSAGQDPAVITLARPLISNEMNFTLRLPTLSDQTIRNIQKVTASMSTDALCTGRQRGRVGVSIRLENGAFKVVDFLPNSPARLTGLRVGDQITHVDGVALTGLTTEQVVARMSGKPDTKLTILIYRKEDRQAYKVELTRYDPRDL
jgi:hypothetical protein